MLVLLNTISKSSFFYPILVLVIIYALVCLFLYFFQKKFIFYPTQLTKDYRFTEFPDAREQYFDMPNGNRLHALYFQSKQAKGIILFFHGNAGALDKWGYAAQDFTRRNYDVLMPDYPTYGKSTGVLREDFLHQDAAYLYDYLDKNNPDLPIIIYGRSLGTGIASTLASKRTPQQVILETPYLSLIAMAKKNTKFLPVQLLLNFHLRSDLRIQELSCPVHIFHGTNDELIPYQQAVDLAALSSQKNILTTVPGGGHNDLGRFKEFQRGLDLLLD